MHFRTQEKVDASQVGNRRRAIPHRANFSSGSSRRIFHLNTPHEFGLEESNLIKQRRIVLLKMMGTHLLTTSALELHEAWELRAPRGPIRDDLRSQPASQATN